MTYHSFNTTDIGNRTFLFNVTDTFNYINNTNDSQIITPDTVYIYYVAASDYEPASIDRLGSSTGQFKFRVRDTDNGTWVSAGINTSFWFGEDNSYAPTSWGPRFTNTTESDGFSYLNFNPNCSYIIGTGVHYWYGGIFTDDYRYAENYTETTDGTNHDYIIRGQLMNWIITPNWSSGQPTFNVTDQIPIRFNVSSECSNIGAENPISNIDSVEIELQDPSTTWESPYSPDQYQAGHYNITWDSTTKQEGNWSIRLNTTENYYNDNSTYLQDWFWLENIPPYNETVPAVSPTSDGWSMLYNYTINLTDQENDETNCTLYVSTDNQANWSVMGMDTLATGNGICEITVHNFTTTDLNFSSGLDNDNFFYFTIQDVESDNDFNTSITPGPILEPANITITEIAGNGTSVNITSDSSQYTQFILYINDTDNSSMPIAMNMTTWVQLNSTVWDWSFTNQTNSSGYLNYYFAPNCSYSPGTRVWYSESSDLYYDYENTTNFTVQLNGTLTNYLLYPTGQEFLRESNVTISVRVNDTCGNNITDANISIYLISAKSNETFNCSTPAHVGDGIYNCTFNTSANPGIMPAKGYTVEVNTSRQFYNRDNISISYVEGSTSFWIETAPYLTNPTYNTSDQTDPYGWGETWTFYVNLTNEDHDSIDLDLWLRNNISGPWGDWVSYKPSGQTHTIEGVTTESSIQSYTLESHNDFDANDIGSWNFKWNATEDDAYIDETSYTNFSVTPDNVEVLYSLGNNSVLNRSNTSDTETLRIRVNDTDRDLIVQLGGTAYFYVTTNNDTLVIPESQYTWQLDTSTGISGQFYTDTFPSAARCVYPIGPQKWRVNYTNEGNGYYNVSSDLYNINLTTEPLITQIQLPVTNTTIRKYIDTVLIRGNVTDDCAATNGPLSNATTVTFTVEEESYTCSGWNDEGNGWYNCTIPSNDMDTWLYDYYNISMQATKKYYNSSIATSKLDTFILVSNPTADTMTVSSTPLEAIYTPFTYSNYGWGELFTFTAYFQDED
ncbi:MAG: hypothetical protein ACXABY_18440, partial [Candidatus Thorarchaeota archaeon]